MNPKALALLLAAGVLAAAAWFVQAPTGVRADAAPVKYEPTVSKALAYLARNQAKDGHWESDGGNHPVAMTGLVALALLMETVDESAALSDRDPRSDRKAQKPKYAAHLRAAGDWLLDKSRRDGLIHSGHASETSRYMEGHGLATLFLADALSKESDPPRRKKLEAAVAAAVRAIVKAQSSQGGWYHTSRVEGHDFDEVVSTAIQVQALLAVEVTSVEVPRLVVGDGQRYLKAQLPTNDGNDLKKNRPLAAAAALACNHRQGELESGPAAKGYAFCRKAIPAARDIQFGRDELVHHYYAQALLDRPDWHKYSTDLFDRLQPNQNEDGSWPAAEGIGAGRVYATALWCVVLQLENRSHPSRRQILEID